MEEDSEISICIPAWIASIKGESFLPQLHKELATRPELAIRFWDIEKNFSDEAAFLTFKAFWLGKIDAFNLKSHSVGSACANITCLNALNYIEGKLQSRPIEGTVKFGDISPELSRYGKFQIFSDDRWSFKLHDNVAASPLMPEKGQSVTLGTGFRRIGKTEKPKQIFISILNHAKYGAMVSAECEEVIYRGTDSNLFKWASEFFKLNGFNMNSMVEHIYKEELCFLVTELLTKERLYPNIIEAQRAQVQVVRNEIHQAFNQFIFSREDIDKLLKDGDLKNSKISTPPEWGQERVAQQEDSPRYIFRKRNNGWDILFGDEKVVLGKNRGCIFIQQILQHESGYTPYDLEDKFDYKGPTSGTDVVSLCEDNLKLTAAASKEGNAKIASKYTHKINEIRRDIDKLELEVELQKNPEKKIELKQDLQSKKSLKREMEKSLKEVGFGYGKESDEAKNKRGRVDVAIKRAFVAIAKQNPTVGYFFATSVQKLNTIYAEGSLKKWQYRPLNNIVWEIE